MTRAIMELQQPWKEMVIWWYANRQLIDLWRCKYHPSQYETPKRSKTETRKEEDPESDIGWHERVSDTKRGPNSSQPVLINKKSPGIDGFTNEMLTHVGNSAIWELLKNNNHIWSISTLPHIWREAIIIPISFDKRHTWKPHIANQRGRLAKADKYAYAVWDWWADTQYRLARNS